MVYDNTSASFCRLGISLGKPRSRCAQTAWKGPGNDVTYISDGAFGDRTKKEGQLQPTAPLFQLPWSKQHQPEKAFFFSLICPFSTKTSCWLPPDLAGISHPYPKDRDCTTWVLVLHTHMSKLDSLPSRLQPELSWPWHSFPKDQQDNPGKNRENLGTYGFSLALLSSTCNSLAEQGFSPSLPHPRSQASTFPFPAGPQGCRGWQNTQLALIRAQRAPKLIAFQAEFNQGLRSMNVELGVSKLNRTWDRGLHK